MSLYSEQFVADVRTLVGLSCRFMDRWRIKEAIRGK